MTALLFDTGLSAVQADCIVHVKCIDNFRCWSAIPLA